MFFKKLGQLVRILYFVRVSLITLIVLPGLGYLAWGPLRQYLEGLLNLGDNRRLGLVSVAVFCCLTGAAAVTSINVTLWYGRRRFQLPFTLDPHRCPLLIFFTGLASATSLYVFVGILSPFSVWDDVVAGLAGLAVAALLIFVAKFVQLWFTDPEVTRLPPPYLVFPVYLLPGMNRFFNRIYQRPPTATAAVVKKKSSAVTNIFFRLLEPCGRGYFIPHRRPLKLYSGHVFSVALATLSLIVYLLIGKWKQDSIGQTQSFAIPSLSYVLLAIMVFCWAFSGLAFFLDRYRFPALIGFFLLTQITCRVPDSDHYFRVLPRPPKQQYAKPADVLKHFSKGHVPVLVAAAGGGIQAAAWETEVLARVEQECRKPGNTCDFTHSIALISGVSGGSVGAMHVGAAFPNLDQAAANARRPSLDDVAWGWINPDVWRTVLPWSIFRDQLVDRGWALERSLEEIGGPTLKDVPLSQWADDTPARLPAFLFNATVVENGAPLIFATSEFPKLQRKRSETTQATSFDARFNHKLDLRVATAARLSASFPYVAPAARANDGNPKHGWHIVDGGYYDNYGLFTLMDWLDDALSKTDPADLPQKIVILRITSFPDGAPAEPALHGWGFQVPAPLNAFLSVRTDAQAVESLSQLEFFEKYWTARLEKKKPGFAITDELIQYPGKLKGACASPPLSWKLTQEQQDCVAETAWRSRPLMKKLREFVEMIQE